MVHLVLTPLQQSGLSPQTSKPPSRAPSTQAIASDSSTDRRSSTGILRPSEVTKPPATSYQPHIETPSPPKSHEEEPLSADVRVELENLRAEIKVLTEELEMLKAKRVEDRAKLKEAESMKVQLAQLEENRKLMQEKSADLQRQLAQAKSVGLFSSSHNPSFL